MFTDIVGYTALMGEDEQRAFQLLKKNRQVQRPIIEKFNGRWLKEIGDGVLASFPTVTDAVYCAATIQKTCENEPDLKLRIGIHLGEVIFEENDVFGDGVNIASRLEPLAPIGGILVSESVHRNLGNKKSIVSTFLREEQLKNVKEPIKIYSVNVEGVEPMIMAKTPDSKPEVSLKAITKPRKMASTVAGVIIILLLSYFLYSNFGEGNTPSKDQSAALDKSIVVLPFTNLSSDPEQEYFSDGMMEEILNHLVKIEDLQVISRTTSMQLRGSSKSVHEITDELNVATALEGSVRKDGNRVRITVQLIRGDTDMHLWSETYDRELTNIFEVQSEVAKQIASALGVVIAPTEETSIDKVPTTDIAAYDFYIRARHERNLYWLTYDKQHIKTSEDLINKALRIDPEYLMALAEKGGYLIDENNHDSAMVYADRIIGLDPEFNRGYGLRGHYYRSRGDRDLAIENFLKAINLPPKDEAWFWYHTELGRLYSGEPIKALSYFQKGLKKNEEHSRGGEYFWIAMAFEDIGEYEKAEKYSRMAAENACFGIGELPNIYINQGKFKEALQFADSTCQSGGCQRECSRSLFRASLFLDRFEQAEHYFNQWSNTDQDFGPYKRMVNAEIGYVYHRLGRTEEAEKVFAAEIQRLESGLNENSIGSLFALARLYAFTGNHEKALSYLTKHADKQLFGNYCDVILIDPLFESLRDDPKVKAIVKQAQEKRGEIRAQIREMEERGELTL
jgi:adenylate cyclase